MQIVHVGAGTRGRDWLEAARRLPGVKPVGLIDPDSEARRLAAEYAPGLASFAELGQALAASSAQGAVIAGGDVAFRSSQAAAAIAAGLNILVEQPFAEDVSKASAILAEARAKGVAVNAVPVARLTLAEKTLRALVRRGLIGHLTHVSVHDERGGPQHGAADSVYTHLLLSGAEDLARFRKVLGADPLSLMFKTGGDSSGFGTTEALLEFPARLHVHYGGRYGEPTEHEAWFEGTKGVLWTDRRSVWWRRRGWPRFAPLFLDPRLVAKSRSWAESARMALGELRGSAGRPNTPDRDEECVRMAALLLACIESHQTRKVAHIQLSGQSTDRDEQQSSLQAGA